MFCKTKKNYNLVILETVSADTVGGDDLAFWKEELVVNKLIVCNFPKFTLIGATNDLFHNLRWQMWRNVRLGRTFVTTD